MKPGENERKENTSLIQAARTLSSEQFYETQNSSISPYGFDLDLDFSGSNQPCTLSAG
ncbi:MAG: hypothetical protein DMF69_16720 [Acidobacteria bacterium]|nr:MAG: hypothetical protein DMF69_16720 [Acidobacteriota bacterium]